MSRGINKAILIGHLGADPEIRYMPSGQAVANVSLATSESWKDKQSGEAQERTEWHRVCFFNRLAEIVGEYCRKGSKVYIEGRIQTRKWQDQNGVERYTTEIIASEMQMLDSKGGAPMGGPMDSMANSMGSQAAPRSFGSSEAAPVAAAMTESFEDEMPF